MTFDPTGTKPGLAALEDEPKTFFLKCKKCGHNEAVEVPTQGPAGHHLYRCVKCHYPAGIQTGTSFDI